MYYQKESEQERKKLEKMKTDNTKDDHDVKKQVCYPLKVSLLYITTVDDSGGFRGGGGGRMHTCKPFCILQNLSAF